MSSSWDEYLKNAYLKTGSLMAKGARSAVLLAGGTVAMQDMAFAFGRNLGMAMQVCKYLCSVFDATYKGNSLQSMLRKEELHGAGMLHTRIHSVRLRF